MLLDNMPLDKTAIPKTIWMMWLQGLDNAPYIVQKCYASWKKHNPDWNIVFLDESNYRDYVNIQKTLDTDNKIEVQAKANLIRIQLLAKYGGIWIDATCFCLKPLDGWLQEHAKAGFFAFDRPSNDRLMENWFMASSADCYLTKKLNDEANAYWLSNKGLKRHRNDLVSRIVKLFSLNRHITRYTFSYPVRKVLKAYPYHWFMYLFTELVRSDVQFREIWNETVKISAIPPHRVQRFGMLEPLTEELKKEIDAKPTPLYKLTWKYDKSQYKEGCVLYYLLESV